MTTALWRWLLRLVALLLSRRGISEVQHALDSITADLRNLRTTLERK